MSSGNYIEGWLIRHLGKESKSDTRTVKHFLKDYEKKNYLYFEPFADDSNRHLVIFDDNLSAPLS